MHTFDVVFVISEVTMRNSIIIFFYSRWPNDVNEGSALYHSFRWQDTGQNLNSFTHS